MLILGLLGMYFDAVVVEVKTFLLLFRLAMAILCCKCCLYLVQIFGRNETQDRPPRLPWERKKEKLVTLK